MVGISVLTLVPGKVGGSETYVRALMHALAEHGQLDYRVLAPPVAPDAGGGLPTTVVREYGRPATLPQRFAAMTLAALRPEPIRRHAAGLEAAHYPLTIALPELGAPFAVTLHDVLHADHPELFPRVEGALRKVAYDRSARRARIVVVPSEFVRTRVVERLRLSAEKIRVIPHGIDHGVFFPAEEPTEREPFLLYPARPWPHKNHARLLAAFAQVRAERPELRLVLTGGGHDGRAVRPGVDVMGLVSRDELVSLLRRASALIFPSLYEGFGAPPLEAMACGCPVAASAAGSLPEVCGDAALLFDPRSVDAIADAIRRVLDHPDDLVERGLAWAQRFTWRASAEAHESAYRELTG